MPTVEETMVQWRGHNVVAKEGDKIGKIDDIYLDEQTNKPEWALVNLGLFGGSATLVPLAGAVAEGDAIRVQFDKDKVKNAPNVLADRELSQEEEQELYAYYGIPYGESESGTGFPDRGDPVGEDVSGPETDEAMTRSEEEVRVGKVQRESGRARLRKYIVTDEVQATVPVQREEVRIEREPITEANLDQALDGPELSEEEHELVLHEEEVVVDKQVVPKERVRLDKDVTVEEQQVSEEVRREQIEAERE